MTVFVVAAVFASGYLFGLNKITLSLINKQIKIERALPQTKKDLNFSLFWQVWDTLESKYFDKTKIDYQKMIYGAISGMVASIGDPYTVFLPPSGNKVIQEDLNGSFEGVGIQIGFKGSQLAVVAPLKDSPAEEAGIKAGDFIIHIKDEKKNLDIGTGGISLPDAVAAIRGPAGSKVTLTLIRGEEEKPIVVEVARTKLTVPSLTLEYPSAGSGQIAYIRLLKFGGETAKEWEEVVAQILKNPKVKGIVIDVRNNPGGYLQAAVDLASDFVKKGEVIVIEQQASGVKENFTAEKIARLTQIPVVVIINQGSASASEILAGALRDQKRAKLVGETTFGKGTIQEPIQIEGGSGLHITTARWLTPAGTWVNDKGLEPDVKIEDDPKTEEDEQLQKAIEILNPKP